MRISPIFFLPIALLLSLQGWSIEQYVPVDLSSLCQKEEEISTGGFGTFSEYGNFDLSTVRSEVDEIPFQYCSDKRVIPLNGFSKIEIPIGIQASELYFQMGAKLPKEKIVFERKSEMFWFDTPERFLINVNYEDGISDEVFPLSVGIGHFWVRCGYDTYCLPELRPVPIRSITFRNRMETAKYLITAITLNCGKGQRKFPEYSWQPPFAPVKTLPPKEPYIHEIPEGYELCDGLLKLQLNVTNGIVATSLTDCVGSTPVVSAQSGPVFKYIFELDDSKEKIEVTSEQVNVLEHFIVEENNGQCTLIVSFQGASGPAIAFHGTFRIQLGELPQLYATLDFEYDGLAPAIIKPVFPIVTNLTVGDIPETWGLWLQRGGFLNKGKLEWGNLTGHYSMQFTDAFNPATGLGVLLMTQDKRSVTRYWHYKKNNAGVSWDIALFGQRYEPHEKVMIPPAVLRLHSGDWREAAHLYREWLNSWYHPISPRKEWFSRVFCYQQTTAAEMYDKELPGKWNVPLGIDTFRKHYGYLDLLHIFDFGHTLPYGRVGSYTEYGFGGRKVMRDGMDEIKRQGVHSSIYFETYNIHEKLRLGNKNFQDVVCRMPNQSPRKFIMQGEWVACPGVEKWRNHLLASIAEVCRDMEPDCLYIDQGGHLGTNLTCYSPNHGHRVPGVASEIEAEFYSQLRRLIPDKTVIITEETPNDVNTQYYDGALTYSVAHNMGSFGGGLTGSCIDFVRFWIPGFKQIQLVQYNPYDDVNGWNMLKYPFFNAQGYWWNAGIRDRSPLRSQEAIDFMQSVQKVMHTYIDCFSSWQCEPLLPTLRQEIFCNRFDGKGRSAFTFYNCAPVTRRGPTIEIPHKEGTSYIDAFSGVAIKATYLQEKGADLLEITIGPHDVACVIATWQP